MTIFEMYQEIQALPRYTDISIGISSSMICQMEVDSIRPDGLVYNDCGMTIVRYGTPTCHFVLPDTDQVTKSANAEWIDYDIRYPDDTRASVLIHLN